MLLPLRTAHPDAPSGPLQDPRPHVEETLPADLARLVPAAIYTARTGAEGEWLHVSPHIEVLLGYAPEEFLDDAGLWARLLHPDDRDRMLATEDAALFGGEGRCTFEYRLVARDGRTVWVLDDVTLLPDPTYGSLQHGVLLDVSGRKQSERLLAEQARIFGLVARGDRLADVLAALAGSVHTVTGVDARVVLPGDPDGGRAPSRPPPGSTAGREETEELCFGDAAGQRLGSLLVTGYPSDPSLRDPEGRPDLDWALRLAAIAVGQARQDEREARAYSLLEATLESTADGILVVDDGGGIVGHNHTFREMWRLPEDVLGTGDDELLVAYVMSQLGDPEAFGEQVARLYASPEESSFDELVFRDGRVFERYSQPQWLDGRSVGRVWSFRDVTDFRHLESQLRRQAHTDALTGLPNRHMFMGELTGLSSLATRGRAAGLLLIDVDDFKTVNDGLGHVAGDTMLVELAGRLRRCVRGGDIAARLGGDEFAVLLTEPATERDAGAVAERIVATLAEPMDLHGRRLSIRVSIGIALSADCTTTPQERMEELMRNADLAMYRSKRAGGAGFRFFEQSMHREAIARLNLQADLARAIEDGALSVAYQPIVRLAGGEIVGVEALARWTHPELGPISPVDFIPLAEDTGIIDRLGRWVLERACTDVADWKASHAGLGALSVSVNLSPHQLSNPGLVDEVGAILARTGLAPGDLCLEVTESALTRPEEETEPLLRGIHALGVRLALDDFGTGHSSLSRLATYPFDQVKVDRAFVSRIVEGRTDRDVVEAVLRIAEAFGLEVVAEGIETPEQLDALRALGCARGQGYLFHRPLDAAAVQQVLCPGPPERRVAPPG